VDWDRSISTNSMFLHQCNKLGLCQIVWWTRLTFHELHLCISDRTLNFINHNMIQVCRQHDDDNFHIGAY
jgi:hypothetical protein